MTGNSLGFVILAFVLVINGLSGLVARKIAKG